MTYAGLQIRPACENDMPPMVRIDSLAHDRGARECRIAQWVAAANGGSSGGALVASLEGEVRGFLAYQQVLDRATLLDVAVHPDYRGQGLASALMQAALDSMRSGGAVRCELEVRASNGRAIALYNRNGFVRDGVRAGYYPGEAGREDAVLMSVDL
jgi:ribosomal-protein-alanine N-acetyltransferase